MADRNRTENYGLIKPDLDEIYNIEDYNSAMDTIDSVIKEVVGDADDLREFLKGKVDPQGKPYVDPTTGEVNIVIVARYLMDRMDALDDQLTASINNINKTVSAVLEVENWLAGTHTYTDDDGTSVVEDMFIYELEISGMTSEASPIIAIDTSAIDSKKKDKAVNKVFGLISKADATVDNITFTCFGKCPTINIPILIKGFPAPTRAAILEHWVSENLTAKSFEKEAT